jgi:hypothetical protein
MDYAMDAVEAGAHVLKGIKNNQLFIISHPEYRDVLRARHAKIEASISNEPVYAVRAESVRFRIRSRWPAAGMIVNGRSFGSRAQADVSSGIISASLHISWKSAPTSKPCIRWCWGGGPSERTTDLPRASWPVTTRLVSFGVKVRSRSVIDPQKTRRSSLMVEQPAGAAGSL